MKAYFYALETALLSYRKLLIAAHKSFPFGITRWKLRRIIASNHQFLHKSECNEATCNRKSMVTVEYIKRKSTWVGFFFI